MARTSLRALERTPPHALRQIVTNLILTPTMAEFGGSGAWIKLGQAIGFLIGAAFWGLASDVWGRRSVSRDDSLKFASHPLSTGHQMGVQHHALSHRNVRTRGEWLAKPARALCVRARASRGSGDGDSRGAHGGSKSCWCWRRSRYGGDDDEDVSQLSSDASRKGATQGWLGSTQRRAEAGSSSWGRRDKGRGAGGPYMLFFA